VYLALSGNATIHLQSFCARQTQRPRLDISSNWRKRSLDDDWFIPVLSFVEVGGN
jgi:hypothetical protein